jgi:hypothetical protein
LNIFSFEICRHNQSILTATLNFALREREFFLISAGVGIKGFLIKFSKLEEFLKTFTSDDISDWHNKGGYNYLLETLNKYEYLITFEDKTYLTTIAALCGTKVIVIKNEKYLTPLDFRLNNLTQLFGVAYGLDDISWADKTIGLVKNNIIELQNQDSITVDNFVEYWEKKLL